VFGCLEIQRISYGCAPLVRFFPELPLATSTKPPVRLPSRSRETEDSVT
jgi:hypothetical protein